MMLAWRTRDSVDWGSRAIELARELDDRESLAHALNNVGTALSESGDDRGNDLLEEADRDRHWPRASTTTPPGRW